MCEMKNQVSYKRMPRVPQIYRKTIKITSATPVEIVNHRFIIFYKRHIPTE